MIEKEFITNQFQQDQLPQNKNEKSLNINEIESNTEELYRELKFSSNLIQNKYNQHSSNELNIDQIKNNLRFDVSSEMSLRENVEQAIQLRNKGNKLFKEK